MRAPERWRRDGLLELTRERPQGRPRYAYIPFGGGTRRCTASNLAVQQLQVMLAAIMPVAPLGLGEIENWGSPPITRGRRSFVALTPGYILEPLRGREEHGTLLV